MCISEVNRPRRKLLDNSSQWFNDPSAHYGDEYLREV